MEENHCYRGISLNNAKMNTREKLSYDASTLLDKS